MACVLPCVLAGCGGDWDDAHPGQPVTQRRALFRKIASVTEQMGLVLRDRKDYDPQEFAHNARELHTLSTAPWAHFPPGSDYSPSHALPAVWARAEDFRKHQQDFEGATAQLDAAASAQDMARIRSAHDAVIRSCRACHEIFHRG